MTRTRWWQQFFLQFAIPFASIEGQLVENRILVSGKKLHYNSSRLPTANDPRLAPREKTPSFSVSLLMSLSLLATTSSFLSTSQPISHNQLILLNSDLSCFVEFVKINLPGRHLVRRKPQRRPGLVLALALVGKEC